LKTERLKKKMNYDLTHHLIRCETWLVALKLDYRLGTFESRLMKRIFEPNREQPSAGYLNLA
jgi:hypothetical protein